MDTRPLAVLNASPSVSGRYPNLGPGILLDAGIPLIDDLGADVMRLHEGDRITVTDGAVRLEGEEAIVAEGTVQTPATVEASMESAKEGLAVQLEAFAANTMEYMKRERDLLLNGIGMPEIRTSMAGKHVLVVVRGYSYKEDLRALRAYIRDCKPVIIGVDGGADAVIEAGFKPTMIVGDMDSVSDLPLIHI